MKCRHFHSGLKWLEFSCRDELHDWKNAYCFGEFRKCRYYQNNVGVDTTYENVWVVVVTYKNKEYWKRVTSKRVLNKAINEILIQVLDIGTDNTSLSIKVIALHSSDPGFKEFLSDLQFSGLQLDDTTY
jgi:hypothetical protein